MAGALVALAIASPALAQGNSGGKKPGKTPAPPPGTSALTNPGSTSTPAAASDGSVVSTVAPFAWLDDATVMAPGTVWLGLSMVRWHGSGLTQTIVPVIDGAIGLTERLQIGASVPRVAGGFGTTFLSAKIGVFDDQSRSVKIAVAPTLEIEAGSADGASQGQGRTHWGVPVSMQLDRENARFYGSSGYFSPGIWYAGGGVSRSIGERAGASVSFSRAWASMNDASGLGTAAGPRRNELSGGGSYEVNPTIAVFGSIGRTLGLSAEDGAGTTLSFGLSFAGAPALLSR
jgi:hypothetical protein